jgi:hypothetical protein
VRIARQRRVGKGGSVTYVRIVRISSRAAAVQVVWTYRHGSRDIEHLGSAHTDAEVELLKAVAAQRIPAGQTASWRSPPPGWADCWT